MSALSTLDRVRQISDEQIEACWTVGDLVDVVERHLAAGRAA